MTAGLFLVLGTRVIAELDKAPSAIRPTALRIRLKAEEKVAYDTILRSHQGVPLYKLSVEPDFDIHGNVVTWTLGLFRITRDRIEEENLLAPSRNWHGLQAF